jgi:FKBP-type peptidyl-prolyl cis-trans isomerase
MRLLTIFLVLILFFEFACNNSGEFKKAESGLRYKFISINESGKKPSLGEVLVLRIKILTEKDSVIFDSNLELQQTAPKHAGGSIEDGFSMMHIGDSVHFIIPVDSFYYKTLKRKPEFPTQPGDDLTFQLKLLSIKTQEEIAAENARLIQQIKDNEMPLLQDYLTRENITVKPTPTGLYYIELQKGKGKIPVKDKKVTMNYTAMRIDGRIFDSSNTSGKPLAFTVGKGEVMPGLDEAVTLMREGGKGKFIIPSNLGYKEEGIKGLIPPYSTLIFELELIKVE